MIDRIPHNLIEYLVFAAFGISLATPLMLLNVKFAHRLGLIDWPKARGLAEKQTPIIGHTLVLLSLGYFGFLAFIGQTSGFVVASAAFIALMGHLDDQRSRPAIDKMVIQIFCVVCVVLFDPQIHSAITQRYGAWGTFWAIFFILGLMNAINFIDGIDGLAGMVLGFGSLGSLVYSQHHAELRYLTLFGALLCGMVIPFLYTNVVERRGFLGNVGSYTLSYLLAIQHLSIPMETGNIIGRLAFPGLCFLVPIADATTVLLSRLSSRRSPFQADKAHLHHRLMQSALPLKYILLVFAFVEVMGVLSGTILERYQPAGMPAIPIILCFSLASTVAILVVLVEKTSKLRVQAHFSHLDSGESIFFLKYRITADDGSQIAPHVLHRLESRINSEIRVTDLCFVKKPDTLFLSLKNHTEPFKRVNARLDAIFDQEKVKTVVTIEEGEFIKVARTQKSAAVSRPAMTN